MSSRRPRATIGLIVAGGAAALLFSTSFANGWGRVSLRSAPLGEAGRLPATVTGFDAWEGYGPILHVALVSGLATALAAALLLVGVRARPGIVLLPALLMSSLFVAGVASGPDLNGIERLRGVEVSTGVLVITGYVLCAASMVGAFAHVRSTRRRS